MNNYKVKPASSTRSAMLKMEQQISDNLSSVRDSLEQLETLQQENQYFEKEISKLTSQLSGGDYDVEWEKEISILETYHLSIQQKIESLELQLKLDNKSVK